MISASNVFTDSHVISGPALEVVAELGHRAFLPCSLSSPQVLSIKFLNLKTVSQVMASNPIPPPHFKGFQRMNQETYIQNIFKYHSCIIDLVRHKHHNFNPARRSSTTRALVQRGEAGKANLHGRPQRCNSSTNNLIKHKFLFNTRRSNAVKRETLVRRSRPAGPRVFQDGPKSRSSGG